MMKEDRLNPLWGSWSGDSIVLFFLPDIKIWIEKNINLYATYWFRELANTHRQLFQGNSKLRELIEGLNFTSWLISRSKGLELFDDISSIDHCGLECDGPMKGLFGCSFYSAASGQIDIAEFRDRLGPR
jgi:hypothetical protein